MLSYSYFDYYTLLFQFTFFLSLFLTVLDTECCPTVDDRCPWLSVAGLLMHFFHSKSGPLHGSPSQCD